MKKLMVALLIKLPVPLKNRIKVFCLIFLLLPIALPAQDISWHAVKNQDYQALSCRRPQGAGLYDRQANTTFYCWPGIGMEGKVRAFDHGNNQYSEIVDLEGYGYDDFHNYPTMIRDQEGYLHVFIASHGREGMYQYTSHKPRSITEGFVRKELDLPATYQLPLTTPEGDLYVAYRASRGGETWGFDKPLEIIKSEDNGQSWSQPQKMVNFQRDDKRNTIYCASIEYAPAQGTYPDRIIIAWTRAGPYFDGQGYYDNTHNDLYVAYLSLEDHHMYNAEGEDMGTTINEGEEAEACKVFDNPEKNFRAVGYTMMPTYDDEGNPVVTFTYARKPSHPAYPMIAYFKEGDWSIHSLQQDQYGGIAELERINEGKNFRVYFEPDAETMVTVNCDNQGNCERESTLPVNKKTMRAFLMEPYHPQIRLFIGTVGEHGWSQGTYYPENGGDQPNYLVGFEEVPKPPSK